VSANDNATSALDLVRAVDGAIDLIITDFACAVSVGADGACARATLSEADSFDGMPIILRTGLLNEIRMPQDGTTPWQEPYGDRSQLSLFSCLSSPPSTQ